MDLAIPDSMKYAGNNSSEGHGNPCLVKKRCNRMLLNRKQEKKPTHNFVTEHMLSTLLVNLHRLYETFDGKKALGIKFQQTDSAEGKLTLSTNMRVVTDI